jgi:hypothetical protein
MNYLWATSGPQIIGIEDGWAADGSFAYTHVVNSFPDCSLTQGSKPVVIVVYVEKNSTKSQLNTN